MSFNLNRRIIIKIFAIITVVTTSSCVSQQKVLEKKTELSFSENTEIIPLEDRNRRKFDNAVIADLDQDGYLDLLLTEHSRRVEVFWNDKGIFEKGEPFIFGDTHGIAVADFNNNGLIDVLVQPGGGDGKNPRKLRHFQINKNRTVKDFGDFKHFEASRGRAVKFLDINHDGKLDLLTSAFPTLKALDKGNRLYKSDEKTTFKFVDYLPHADRMGMRTSLIDFNGDDNVDIIFYGGQKLVLVQGYEDGTFKEVTQEVLGNLSKTKQVNSVSEIDFDNDGDKDLFLTRSKLPFPSEADYDEENNTFYFFARRKPFDFTLNVKGDLQIENLQMAFPHFDINLGKDKKLWKRKKDRHGHHNLKVTPSMANGFPEDTSKKGLYIGYLGNNQWRVKGHTNSPTTAVIHNVISKPETIELKAMPAMLLENNAGKFSDISKKLGINIEEQTSSTAVGDFNNDGWSDIFVVRFGNSAKQTKQILLLNKEGEAFVEAKTHGIITSELGATGMGADAFDYDKDGDLDIIYANERGKWHLFTNNLKSDNNYVQINVGNSTKNNTSPIGAVVSINACGNMYKRVVGATSSSYSQPLNTYLHIGLGKCTKVDKAEILWANGEKKSFNIDVLNTIHNIGK